jgi:hypothetical protein
MHAVGFNGDHRHRRTHRFQLNDIAWIECNWLFARVGHEFVSPWGGPQYSNAASTRDKKLLGGHLIRMFP